MKRALEIDILRSVAIAGMVIYHTAYDLQMFYGWDIDVLRGGWELFQIMIASLFLFLVGITSSFSSRHPLQRFLRIGGAALLVTIATYAMDPTTYVRFGILHLIAVCALIMPVIRRYGIGLLIPAAALLALNPIVSALHPHTALLLPLGFMYPGFSTVDYFPLVPWFGVVLMGCIVAPWLLPHMHEAKRSIISWPGQHSLLLYIIHQPIILGILWVVMGAPGI